MALDTQPMEAKITWTETWIRWSMALFGAALPLSIAAANVGGGLLCLGFFLHHALGKHPFPWRKTELKISWFGYLLAAFLASGCGVDVSRSLWHLRPDLYKMVLYWLLLQSWTPGRFARYWRGYLCGSLLAALAGILQVVASGQGNGSLCRAHAWVHPVTYGEQMALALLGVSALLAKRVEFPLDLWKTASAAVLLLGALLLSQTRGAWIGLSAGLGVLCVCSRVLRRWTLILIAAGLLFVMLGPRSVSRTLRERGASILSTEGYSNRVRLELWKTGWAIYRDHLFTGVGPANFKTVFSRYHPEPLGEQTSWGNAHNIYLHQAAERGTVGLLALFYLFYRVGKLTFRKCRTAPGPVTLWAWAGVISFLIMNLTESAFQDAEVWMQIACLVSGAEVLSEEKQKLF